MLEFFCATASKPFDSGIVMDRDTYNRQRLAIVNVMCPHCAKQHRFLLADGQFKAEAA